MRDVVYCENRDFYLKIVFHMLRILNFKRVYNPEEPQTQYTAIRYAASINDTIYKFYYYHYDTSKTIMLKVDNMLVADSTVIKRLARLLGYE
jgi:hypothetical protein